MAKQPLKPSVFLRYKVHGLLAFALALSAAVLGQQPRPTEGNRSFYQPGQIGSFFALPNVERSDVLKGRCLAAVPRATPFRHLF